MALEKIIEDFASMGSGWQLVLVKKIILKTGTYNPLGGSSFLPTPLRIQRTHAILNIQNFFDDKCFLWCVLAKLHPLEGAHRGQASRVSKYRPYEHELRVEGLHWPLELKQLDAFEKMNPNISVNVLGLDEDSCMVPLRVTKHSDRLHEVDLLLLTHGDAMHYTLIRNISRLISYRTKNRLRQYVCRCCLHPYTSEDRLAMHLRLCSKHSPARIIMPSSQIRHKKDERPQDIEDDHDRGMQQTFGSNQHDDVRLANERIAAANIDDPSETPSNRLRFKHIQCQFPVGWIIYADFEAIVDESGKHIPSGFCCLTVSELRTAIRSHIQDPRRCRSSMII